MYKMLFLWNRLTVFMLSFRYKIVNIRNHVYIGNRQNIKTKGAESSTPFGNVCYI